jgi:endo-1,4-beta-D-glucanase Y
VIIGVSEGFRFETNRIKDADCIPDWAACSVDDDNALPCCDGLYCKVSSAYYAQCVELDGPSPTPAPYKQKKSPSPTVKKDYTYACGFTVSNSNYVNSEYTQWKNKYVVSSDAGSCISRPQQGNDCVSEGLGYGMLLSASLNDQDLFDDLWAFTQYVSDDKGLPNWDLTTDGNVIGSGSATDADLDIALALVLAYSQWNDDNYLNSAKTFISSIMANDMDYSDTLMTLPGDSWGAPYPYNPSYFSPAHMEVFYSITSDSRWLSAIEAGYKFLNNSCASKSLANSGLVPDWTASLTDCTASNDIVIWDLNNGADYYYDAIRTPWRIAMHAAWNCDESALNWMGQMSSFFQEKGVHGILLGFDMQGNSLGGDDNTCFISTSATAMVPVTNYDTVSEWWDATKGTYDQSGLYFCDTLRLLSLTFQAGLLLPPNL